jgi:mycothiol maleylpyruvate isomerase-like protein
VEWPALSHEVRNVAARCATLLRNAPDPHAIVPPTTWTVTEIGNHLLSLPRRYRAQIEEPVAFPVSLSAYNQLLNETINIDLPDDLADTFVREIGEFMDFLGEDPARPVPFYGFTHTASGLAGITLGELLMHGLDLARSQGQHWPITRSQALAVFDGFVPTLGNFVDPKVALKASGLYHLHLRGGPDWTVRLAKETAEFERVRPTRADLHLSADPVAYLLVGFKRRSQWRALLGGQIVAWGRKPWLAMRFSRVFAEN